MAEQADLQQTERIAQEYLRTQLGDRTPSELRPIGEFDEAPLDGEGRTVLFSFDLEPGPGVQIGECPGGADRRHFVAVGQTEPNFFPAYGMSPDEAYSFHLGTRFMLQVGVCVVDAELEPPGARAALHKLVANHARDCQITNESLAGLFRCEDSYFAVYKLTLDGREVYCMGADCPPGFYTLTKHAPQTVLRLHLGNLIRAEARNEAATDATA